MFYQSIKQRKSVFHCFWCVDYISRKLEKCRKHLPTARVFYISLVFSNVCRVLSQCNTQLRLLYLVNISPQNFILLPPRQSRKGWSWNKVYTIKQTRKINKCITLLCNNYCFFISWNELLSTGICLTKLVYTVDLCWSHKNFYFVFSFLLRILLWLLQEGLGPLLYKNMSSSNLNLSSPKICTPKLNFWLLPTMSSSMN